MFQASHVVLPFLVKIFGIQISYIIPCSTLNECSAASLFLKIFLNKLGLFRERKNL